MYCSKCGAADQDANSYCRKCGSFRLDSLKKEMTTLLIGNFFTLACCFSLLLLWIIFTILYYIDGMPFPNSNISNYFLFVALMALMFSNFMFFVGVLRKMNKNSGNSDLKSEETQPELKNFDTKDLLPPADLNSVVPSVVEETTRNLVKVGRK